MKQLPDSLLAFQHMVPDDDACAAWLIEMRWPDGFVCPRCGHEKGWALRRKAHTFACTGCRRQTSVTAGTILHVSKLPLTVWFWAADLMATHSNGISALQLQKQLASALIAAPGCSPTSCAPAWSSPSVTRCRAWWTSTRPAVHVVGKTAAYLVLPWIHQVFSNLKGWARGVYHGLHRKHLQAYLDEVVFRFNRRKTRHDAFRSLFRLATNAQPLTYSILIEPEPSA